MLNTVKKKVFQTYGIWLSLLWVLSIFGMSIAHADIQQRVRYVIPGFDGSPKLVVDDQGFVVKRMRYAPFGEMLLAKGTSPKRGFVGGQQETFDLVYLQHRYYNPVIGRFYQPDPVTFLEGGVTQVNRYQYALNDPYMYKDSDGRNPVLLGEILYLACIRFCMPAAVALEGLFVQGPASGIGGGLKQTAAAVKAANAEMQVAKQAEQAMASVAQGSAESAANAAYAAGKRSGAAAELRVGDRIFTGVSGEVVPHNPQVTAALMGTPQAQRAAWHGGCAEIVCLDKALNAGVNPAGGTMRAVNIGVSGAGHNTPKVICSSCDYIQRRFGVGQ